MKDKHIIIILFLIVLSFLYLHQRKVDKCNLEIFIYSEELEDIYKQYPTPLVNGKLYSIIVHDADSANWIVRDFNGNVVFTACDEKEYKITFK